MKFAVTVRRTLEQNLFSKAQNDEFERHDIAHKFADELTNYLLTHKECNVRTTPSYNGAMDTHYELNVLTNQDLRELVLNIESAVRNGYPVVI